MRDCSTDVTPLGRHRTLLTAAAVLAAALVLVGVPSARALPVALRPPQVISPASAGATSLGGLAIARDGTGGLVYLANVGGTPHVMVSRLVGGSFLAPEQLDSAFAGPSSQPVLAAGNGGLLLVAFINGGELYAVEDPGANQGWGPPDALYAGAQSPSISMSSFGKAYLAFTAAESGGYDVRSAYFNGSWSPVTAPLNANPADDAGTGSGAPDAGAAGDGIGIVAWGEGGHVYARRVVRGTPSTAVAQLDPGSYGGAGEVSADLPALSVGGDSSYVDVVYRETLSSGGQTRSRVLLTRMVAETAQPAVSVDGLDQSSDPGVQPAVAMNEYGRGFATAADASTNTLLATHLNTNGAPGAATGVESGPSSAPPYASPGIAGLTSTVIAWQQAAVPGSAQVFLRYAADGSTLGPQMQVSDAKQGPAQGSRGLFSGGDSEGDAAVAWVQGTTGLLTIDVAQLYVPPGSPQPSSRLTYTRQPQPTLSWAPAREAWGPVSYAVTLDGQPLGSTTGTSTPVPAPLVDGPHLWQVQAANPAGETSTSPAATVFVDTTAPHLRLLLSGVPRVGVALTLQLSPADLPPGQPGAQASGVSLGSVRFGDGTPAVTSGSGGRVRHAYLRPGLYRMSAQVRDQAGNVTMLARYVRILP